MGGLNASFSCVAKLFVLHRQFTTITHSKTNRETHQIAVENLPDGVHGYATKDVFERHPSNPDLYKMYVHFASYTRRY